MTEPEPGHRFEPLDLLRPCPACGMCLIGESLRRCVRCDEFANRRRTVTDQDWNEAIAAGLITDPNAPAAVPKSTEDTP